MLRAINNARVVTPDGIIESGSVVLEGGRISGVFSGREGVGETLDAGGRYVLPGIVDLHSDAIENQLTPRPGIEFPARLAFLEMDRYFATSGITTGFHAVAFLEGRGRSIDRGRELYELVVGSRHEGLVRHELHLRCELPQDGAVEAVEIALGLGAARIASVMDHTPGQGQFRDLEWYRRYHRDHRGADDEDLLTAISEAERGAYSFALDRVERVALAARENGVVLASHDDDSAERVEALAACGVGLSEFPINAESARRAKELGVSVCMGAPNVVRGRSSGGNLDATSAVELGLVDALCSDYYPPGMLQAAFKLVRARGLPLPAAAGLVSSGPARAAGLADRGEVREGALADLLVVGERLGLPAVTHTIVDGAVRHTAG